MVDEDGLRELEARKPAVLTALLKAALARTRELEALHAGLAHKDTEQKVAALLLRLCEKESTAASGSCEIETALTHQEMADLVGVSRETLTRSLGELRRAGLIETGRRWLKVTDAQRLKDLAA